MSWDNIIIHLKQTQHIYRTCGVGSVCRDRRGTANVCSLSFTAQLFLLTDTENPPWSPVLISNRSVSTTRQLYTNSFLVTSSLRRLTRKQSGKNLGCREKNRECRHNGMRLQKHRLDISHFRFSPLVTGPFSHSGGTFSLRSASAADLNPCSENSQSGPVYDQVLSSVH